LHDAQWSKSIFEKKYGKADEEMRKGTIEIPFKQQYCKWKIQHKCIMSEISCLKPHEYELEILIIDSIRAKERDEWIKLVRASEI